MNHTVYFPIIVGIPKNTMVIKTILHKVLIRIASSDPYQYYRKATIIILNTVTICLSNKKQSKRNYGEVDIRYRRYSTAVSCVACWNFNFQEEKNFFPAALQK